MSAATDTPAAPPPGRSWRAIRQEVRPNAMSRRGRRRQLAASAKFGALLLLVVGLGWGAYVVAASWASDRGALATAVRSDPVNEVLLITDGVLTKAWVKEVLALPKNSSLMGLDLPALRDRLLAASGQVRVAGLVRSFPSTLTVTLQERTPVARIQAMDTDGATRALLVAKDGVVYPGLNYDRELIASLPWLDGVRLVRGPAGFEPIAGMADVAALLTRAQLEAPQLYRDWLIVSLARMADADEIVVTAQDHRRITFSRKLDFFQQIALLDSVTDRLKAQAPDVAVESVNLTLGNQVPVRLEHTPADLDHAPAHQFPIPPPQRKAKRDL